MLYEVTYVRSGKTEVFTGSHAQCRALLGYLEDTFGIIGTMHRAA